MMSSLGMMSSGLTTCPDFPLEFEEKIPVRLSPLYVTSSPSLASRRRFSGEHRDNNTDNLKARQNITVTFRRQVGDNHGIYVKIKEKNERVYGMASVERQHESLCVTANIQDGLTLRQLQLTYPAVTSEFLFMDGFYRVTDKPSGKTAVWRAEVEARPHVRKHYTRSELFLRRATKEATGDADQTSPASVVPNLQALDD